MMYQENNFFNLKELINVEGSSVVNYGDLEHMLIKVLEDEVKVNEKLLCIPYKEELCPYNHVMSEYILERDLSIPPKTKAIRYLCDNGLQHEFYDFWNQEAAKALMEWFIAHQINISSYTL